MYEEEYDYQDDFYPKHWRDKKDIRQERKDNNRNSKKRETEKSKESHVQKRNNKSHRHGGY